MPFNKGDIIALDFEMPDTGSFVTHSGVIVSCTNVYRQDKCYICAMMTSNNSNDIFSFHLNDAMLVKPGNKANSQVRCHLITYVREIHIKSDNGNPFNKLKSQALERLLAHINVAAFDN